MIVNQDTGEVWKTRQDFEESSKCFVKHKPTDYVGIDTNWVTDCKDAFALFMTVRQLDGFLNKGTKVLVDRAYILDCVTANLISSKNVEALLTISKHCTAWNYGFCTKAELLKISGVTPRHFARWTKEMEPYFTVNRVNKGFDDLRIVFNPLIVWRGDSRLRSVSIQNYYGVNDSSPSFGENTTL